MTLIFSQKVESVFIIKLNRGTHVISCDQKVNLKTFENNVLTISLFFPSCCFGPVMFYELLTPAFLLFHFALHPSSLAQRPRL